MKRKIGRYLGLLIVTGFALAIAITVTASGWKRSAPTGNGKSRVVMPQTPVSVMEARCESIDITDTYSGMIRPWERYSLGFEVAGRVMGLGANAAGKSLDEGDRVAAGDVLARLDDRVFRSRVEEANGQLRAAHARLSDANARLEKAQSDMMRSERLRRSGSRAITEAEYQDSVTQLALAKAQKAVVEAELTTAAAKLQTAEKNLLDTTLLSPVDAVVSKRMIKPGESVNPQQPIMEIIQVDEVLLVVGVPEAYVGDIHAGQKAYVELLARDRFRRARPQTEGRVHQVAEAADQTTGLFEVEIAVHNRGRFWKPGLIALAHIVLKEVQGFAIPVTSAVFRADKTFLFAVEKDGQALTTVGRLGKARRLELESWADTAEGLPPIEDPPGENTTPPTEAVRYIEQGSDLILLGLPPRHRAVVTRGQHRLMQDRDVQVVQLEENPARRRFQPSVRSPATVAEADFGSGNQE